MALWRQIEEMTPQQRADKLPYTGFIDVEVPAPILRDAPERELVGRRLTEEMHLEQAVMCPVIAHTKQWLRVRRSWMQSKEWRCFRDRYLEEHPQGVRCGSSANVVHHIAGFNLDTTVINFGFLEILEYSECFEALCMECHYQEHKELIEAEKGIRC